MLARNYTFGDRILMDRQCVIVAQRNLLTAIANRYIIDQLPTAIAYFAQNPYRRVRIELLRLRVDNVNCSLWPPQRPQRKGRAYSLCVHRQVPFALQCVISRALSLSIASKETH